MTGRLARTLTSTALAFAVSAWGRAQEAPAAVVPPGALPSEEAERALVTAPVVIDGRAVLHVRGVASFPAGERARLIAERIEAVARDASVPPRVEKTPAAATLALLLLLVLALAGLRRLDRRISRTFDERIHSVQIQSFEIVRAQQMPAYEWNFSDVNPPVHA